MSSMVVRMECDPDFRDEVIRHLREDVVVWAHEQAGFLAGSWHLSDDGTRGLGFVEFASRVSAEAAAQGPRDYHDPGVPFRIASVEVYESVVSAEADG